MTVLSRERCGRITASRAEAVLALSHAYITELIAERGGQRPPETGGGGSEATAWGKRFERSALAFYALVQNVDPRPGEFVTHPDQDYFGATPDGFADPDGLVEIKCPYDRGRHTWCRLNHAVWFRDIAQLQAQLYVTGRQWVDYVSFDPREEIDRQLFILRVFRDDVTITKLRERAAEIWRFVEAGRVPALLENDADGVPELF